MVNVMIEHKKEALNRACDANKEAAECLLKSLSEFTNDLAHKGNKKISIFVKGTRGDDDNKPDNTSPLQ